MKKIVGIAVIILLLFPSCKLTKDQRKIVKASRKIEKLDRKSKRIAIENDLIRTDTATAVVQYISEPVQIDTVFEFEVDTLYLDSLSIIKILPPAHLTYTDKGVTVTLDRIDYYDKWKYKLTVDVVPDTVEIEVEVPFETIQPIEYVEIKVELSGWDKTMMKIGNGLFWIIIVALSLLLLRFVLKKYIPLIP